MTTKAKSTSRRIVAAKGRESEGTWRAELTLRARHRDELDELVYKARRAGMAHRPGYAELLRGMLDAVMPVLLKEDLTELVETTAAHGAREAAPFVSVWVKERLQRRLR